MSLHLLNPLLDAYEAARKTRLDLQTQYYFAVERWDSLEIARIEALAADYDARHPGEDPVLDRIDAPHQPAAA